MRLPAERDDRDGEPDHRPDGENDKIVGGEAQTAGAVRERTGGCVNEWFGRKVAGEGGQPMRFANGTKDARDDDDREVDQGEDRGSGFDGGHGAGEHGGRGSLLSLGQFGWIQDFNFAAAGVLSLCGAIGVRRALTGSVGGIWIPRLLGVVGVGLGAAAVFHPDPSNGFPPGTPLGASATSNWHGVLHLVCGSAAFLALIAASFVFGRRFSRSGDRKWAIFSRAAGILFAVALATSGGHDGSVILFVGVSIGWLGVTACVLHTVRSERVAARTTRIALDA